MLAHAQDAPGDGISDVAASADLVVACAGSPDCCDGFECFVFRDAARSLSWVHVNQAGELHAKRMSISSGCRYLALLFVFVLAAFPPSLQLRGRVILRISLHGTSVM